MNNELMCRVCLKYFDSNNILEDHIKINHFQCKQCGVYYLDPNFLDCHISENHKITLHSEDHQENCDLYDKELIIIEDEEEPRHDKMVVEENIKQEKETKYLEIKCLFCCRIFNTFDSLKHHLKHCLNPQNYCPICYQKFVHLRNLSRHMTMRHKRKRPLEFNCDLCKKKYREKKYLQLHVQNSHIEHTCPICPEKKFIGINLYKEHMYDNHPEIGICLKCPHCNKSFNGSSSLRRHLMTLHEAINYF